MLKQYDSMPDENLLDFIGAANEQAFAALVGRYHTRFYHMAYRWLLNAEDAEDVLQQAFLKLWTCQAKWKRGKKAKFSTWFYTILYHQSIDRLRTRKQSFVELNEEVLPACDNQERDLSADQQSRKLQQILAQLPEKQRIAVQLFYFEELKQKDIAKIMGLSVKALESQLTRAKQGLREQLSTHEEGAFDVAISS
jgi:RNA polymerase sigma-70 factor (ECF subfamily)